MAVTNLTAARIRNLPLCGGIHRDQQVKGLMVICHRTTRTYAVQGDVRRNGRHVRTVRVKIDRVDRQRLSVQHRQVPQVASEPSDRRHHEERRPRRLHAYQDTQRTDYGVGRDAVLAGGHQHR
jgi:hypothetical protein